ncbi:MAG: response regulator [Proteobacteria bacterium]|nr:response regulator [Pseudomonadota bacterium]MBU1581242.1 response regulator [Pseudomonadota bacterium]MBU2455269.1 response regulator [Pseudomonadota bacterium]MBU2630847.1 response regulator [Pseudomonadota bacterium]
MNVKRKRIITNSIFVGFGLLTVVLISCGLFFISEIKTLSKLTHSIYHHPLVVSNTSLQSSLLIIKMHRTIKDVLITSDPSTIEDSVLILHQYEKQVYENLALIKEKILGKPGEDLAQEAYLLFREWKPIRDEMIESVVKKDAKTTALMKGDKCTQHVARMESKMQALTDYAKNKASTFLLQSDLAGEKITTLSYGFLIISVMLSIAIAIATIMISLKGESALIQSEHHHRVIFENSPLGMIRFSSDGIIADCNDKIVDLMGSSKGKLLGFDALGKSSPAMVQAIQKALDGNTSVYEDQYTSVTGNKTTDIRAVFNPVSSGKEVTEVIATFEDITDRKKVEKELQENEKRLQTIFYSVQTGILLVDKDSKTIIDINPAAAQMIGTSFDKIKGKKCHGFVCPAQEGECPIVDSKQTIDNAERFLLTANGRQVPVLKTVTQVSIKGRACLLECFVDISQQKEMEAALRSAKEAAEDSVRSKASFLANMSHEIRTPMNGVIGMTELLSGTKLSPEQQDYVSTIKISGDSLLTIINDILDYSKIEAGKVTFEQIKFNLRTVLEGIADLSAIKAQEKGLEYCTILHPNLPTFLIGDPGRLRQILINLIGNAVKFTEKGEVTISVRLEKETPTHATVHFAVTDTGIGIPENKREMLFESFSQVDASTTRKYGGTGLGLTISKHLSGLMGGQIGVTSQEGKGSCFWFTVVFEKQPEGHHCKPVIRQDIKGKHILIVDDNKTNRFVLQEDLKLWGCRFDEASSGRQALEKLKKAVEKKDAFEIAVIDMQMPEMDGEMLGQIIKQDPRLENTILIMLTSMGMRGDTKRLKKIGFSAYLTKPLKQAGLYDCLATVYHTADDTIKVESLPMITKHSIAENNPQSARILLAEDNPINQKVALISLKKLGFMADAVLNGRQAVQALEKTRYDLVLMDCQMPEMDGYQATAEIRDSVSMTLNPDVPVIAMTANAMEEDRKKCLKAGMNDYLAKPVKLKDLSNMLEKWLPNKGTLS